jgi:hypothetical protein
MFTAIRDGGATLNGCPMMVSANTQLRSSLVSTQVQSDDAMVLDRYTGRLRTFLGVVRAVRSLGAPALALAYVACGRLDAFFEADMSPGTRLRAPFWSKRRAVSSPLLLEYTVRRTTGPISLRPTDRCMATFSPD